MTNDLKMQCNMLSQSQERRANFEVLQLLVESHLSSLHQSSNLSSSATWISLGKSGIWWLIPINPLSPWIDSLVELLVWWTLSVITLVPSWNDWWFIPCRVLCFLVSLIPSRLDTPRWTWLSLLRCSTGWLIPGPGCVKYVCLSTYIIHKPRAYMHNYNIQIFMLHSLPYIVVCCLLLFGDILPRADVCVWSLHIESTP